MLVSTSYLDGRTVQSTRTAAETALRTQNQPKLKGKFGMM